MRSTVAHGREHAGHLPGAVSIPSTGWAPSRTTTFDLCREGSGPEPSFAFTGRAPAKSTGCEPDARVVSERLRSTLEWVTWAADDRLPVERIHSYERLVIPNAARFLEAPTGSGLRTPPLFHVNFGGRRSTRTAYPGALT